MTYIYAQTQKQLMPQLFKLQNQKTWKTLLLNEQDLMVVNKSYDSPEEFMEKFHEKGMLKERLEIAASEISRLAYAEQSNSATITYLKKNDDATLMFDFTSIEAQEQFVASLAKSRNFSAQTEEVSTWRAISSPVVGLAMTALFTFIVYEDAAITEAGGEVDTSGRRSLYKQLFAWLGENLGTQGTLIVGGAVAAFCCLLIYKKIKSRPVEIVYS